MCTCTYSPDGLLEDRLKFLGKHAGLRTGCLGKYTHPIAVQRDFVAIYPLGAPLDDGKLVSHELRRERRIRTPRTVSEDDFS